MTRSDMTKMTAWGQYIHWADIQYNYWNKLGEGCPAPIYFGVMAHWIASQYVVIEGWTVLKLTDETIAKLITAYPDYIDIYRRCRNAVYHFQQDIMDERIKHAIGKEEMYNWLVAIKYEFERYFYLFPFYKYGFSIESMELSNEYFQCVGWKPTGNISVRWFDSFIICRNYIANNEMNKLEHNQENDKLIAECIESLRTIEPNFLLKKLSRI